MGLSVLESDILLAQPQGRWLGRRNTSSRTNQRIFWTWGNPFPFTFMAAQALSIDLYLCRRFISSTSSVVTFSFSSIGLWLWVRVCASVWALRILGHIVFVDVNYSSSPISLVPSNGWNTNPSSSLGCKYQDCGFWVRGNRWCDWDV
jgi:hypothetical protein